MAPTGCCLLLASSSQGQLLPVGPAEGPLQASSVLCLYPGTPWRNADPGHLCSGPWLRPCLGHWVDAWRRQDMRGQALLRIRGQLEGLPHVGWAEWVRGFREWTSLNCGRWTSFPKAPAGLYL